MDASNRFYFCGSALLSFHQYPIYTAEIAKYRYQDSKISIAISI
jgi:hypothetical protein